MKESNSRERIKKLMEIYGMNPYDVSAKTGVSQASIHRYITGERVPKQDKLYLIADAFDVDPSWLMGLDVPMKKHVASEIDTDLVTQLTLGDKNYLWETIVAIANLPREEQNAIITIVKGLSH